MAVQIFIHEPGIGLVDQTGRLFLAGSIGQIFTLTRGQPSTGQIDFYQAPSDTYTSTVGSLIIVHTIVNGVDHIEFRGNIVDVERTWKEMGQSGAYLQTLHVASLESTYLNIRMRPPAKLFWAAGSDPAVIVRSIWNSLAVPLGVPVTLGTIQSGTLLTGDLVIHPQDTLGGVIQNLATQCGFVTGVQMSDGTLYFQAQNTTSAPYTVTDWLIETGDFKQDQTDYRNRQGIQINFSAFRPSAILFANATDQTQQIPYRYDNIQQAFVTSSTQATVHGSFLHGNMAAGDTITISEPGGTGRTYTLVATIDNTVRDQIKVGATAAATCQNIVDAINQEPSTDTSAKQGTTYSWPTWYHQACNADQPSGSPIGFTLRVSLPGSGGNSISVSASSASFTWASPTCSGGTDGILNELNVGAFSSGEGAGASGADVQFTPGATAIFLKAGVITGMSLLVTYYRLGADTIYVEDSAAIAARAVIEGGSGLHEAMLTDNQQYDPFTAYQEILAYLNAYKTIPANLQFMQDKALLSPGQFLTLSISRPPDAPTLINGQYMVQQVQAAYVPGLSRQPEPFGHFRYTVTVISVPEIQTFQDHFKQPFKITPPTPPAPANAPTAASSTPTLKPTTQSSPGTGSPTQGQPSGSAGQNLVQEHLGLKIENSGKDLVMASASTVSSASYAFQPTDEILVIASGTAGWTAGNYPITSVSGGIATISGSPASSGTTGGPWGTAKAHVFCSTWVPTKSNYTGNQIGWLHKNVANADSPLTHTTHELDPFRFGSIGFHIDPISGSAGPDYAINGNTWTLRDIPNATDDLLVEYFPAGPSPAPRKAGDVPPAKYAAISSFAAQAQQIMTAITPSSWTGRSTATDNNGTLGRTMAFGGGKFCCLALDSSGSNWIALTSTDGQTWAQHTVPQPNNQYQSLIWHSGLGLFVGLDAGSSATGAKVITSADGSTWAVSGTIAGAQTQAFNDLCVSGSGLAACQDDHSSDHKDVLTSSDAVTWTPATAIPGAARDWGGIGASGGTIIVVAASGNSLQVARSTDGGSTWSRPTTPTHTPNNRWLSVVKGGGTWVAVGHPATGSGGAIMTSTDDGVTWALQTAPASCGSINYVIWDGTQFIAATSGPGNNTIITSPDGSAWTQQTGAISDTVLGVAFSA